MHKDSADPLEGWNTHDIKSRREAGAGVKHIANDLYGDMYFYVLDIIRRLHQQVRSHAFEVVIQCATVQELSSLVRANSYDRIEISNVMDEAYLGVEQTLRLIRPFLNAHNRKAAMLSLFMNAVPIIAKQHERENLRQRLQDISRYLPVTKLTSANDPDFLRMSAAKDLLEPAERHFEEYAKQFEFDRSARMLGWRRRATNTIIERWPYRLRKPYGVKGYEAEFDDLLASTLIGWETYIEWESSN